MAIHRKFLEDIWYLAHISTELGKGKMVHKMIAGHPIVVGRGQDGKAFALRDICPHRSAPFSAGQIHGDGTVECPYHGWRFGTADGQCKHIPSMCTHAEEQKDQVEKTSKVKVRAYPVREDGNLIWIYIAKDKNYKGVPDIDPPDYPMAKCKPAFIERRTLHAHIDQAIMGLIDPAHVPFIHKQWWWRSGNSMHNKTKNFEPRPRGFSMIPHQPSTNSAGYKLLGGQPITEIAFYIPGSRTEEIKVGKKTLLSLTVMTPIDETTTEFMQVFFTDFKFINFFAPIFKGLAKVFLKQDGDILNLLVEDPKFDPSLLFINDADAQCKWYFQMKKEWTNSRAQNRVFKNPVKPTTLHWRS